MVTRTHIFIDYENVQPSPEEFSRVPKKDVHIWLLHGAHQHDFAATLVREWLPIGERMKILQSNKTGKNAVDVLLALHLGKAQEQDLQSSRSARYVIVSKDNDYSALLPALKQEGASLHRTPSLTAALELIKPVTPKSSAPLRAKMLPEDIGVVIKNLTTNVESRPTRRARMESHILSLLGSNKVTPAVGKAIIKDLESRGLIEFDALKIIYHL